MEGKVGANAKITYTEFEPLCTWQREETRDILVIHLPDFKKEQLKVQINNHDVIKISGERQVNPTTRTKFYKEINAPMTCITHKIHAKFVNGCLYITMPKKTPPPPPPTTTTTTPEQNKPSRPLDDQKKLAEPSLSEDQKKKSKETRTTKSSSSSSEDDDDEDEDTDSCSDIESHEMEKKKKSVLKVKRFAKVAMNLAAVFTVLAGLTAYFIYMYKSVVIED